MRRLKSNLHKAIRQMKYQADKGRSESEFQVRDWVFLKLQAYRQSSIERRKSDKLSPRFYEPYKIVAKVGSVAYTLRLSKGTRVHPTFLVSLLKRCLDPIMAPVHPSKKLAGKVVESELAVIRDRRMVRKKGRATIEVLVQ